MLIISFEMIRLIISDVKHIVISFRVLMKDALRLTIRIQVLNQGQINGGVIAFCSNIVLTTRPIMMKTKKKNECHHSY